MPEIPHSVIISANGKHPKSRKYTPCTGRKEIHMADKEFSFHKLEDQELKHAAGGASLDLSNPPEVICPVCCPETKISVSILLSGKKIKPVKMECVGWYDIPYKNNLGYVYKCPECGHEERVKAKD